MKYIDADKLIAEIDRRIKLIPLNYVEVGSNPTSKAMNQKLRNGLERGLNSIKDFIDSLQQEQPKFKVGDTIHRKGESTVFPMIIESISDGDYVCDGGKCFVSIKFQDDYELVGQEQPEVDFENAYKSYMKSRKDDLSGNAVTVNMKDLARHFYELGLNSRKEE